MFQNNALLGLAVTAIAVLTVLGLHMLMVRKGPAWLGAVMPCLWVITVVVLIVQGRLTPGRPYVVSLAALALLLWIWASARKSRSQGETRDPSGSPRSRS